MGDNVVELGQGKDFVGELLVRRWNSRLENWSGKGAGRRVLGRDLGLWLWES